MQEQREDRNVGVVFIKVRVDIRDNRTVQLERLNVEKMSPRKGHAKERRRDLPS